MKKELAASDAAEPRLGVSQQGRRPQVKEYFCAASVVSKWFLSHVETECLSQTLAATEKPFQRIGLVLKNKFCAQSGKRVGPMPPGHPHAQYLGQGPLMAHHPLVYMGEVAINGSEDTHMFSCCSKRYWRIVHVKRRDQLCIFDVCGVFFGESKEFGFASR